MQFSIEDIDVKTIPDVPHYNEIIRVKIYEVYDGDTIKFLFLHGGMIPMKLKLRIVGIDTPEIRKSKENVNSELEHNAAIVVRDFVKNLIKDKIVYVKMEMWDKFGGRVLGNLYFESPKALEKISIADILLEKKMAQPYDGGHKKKFEKEFLEFIINIIS